MIELSTWKIFSPKWNIYIWIFKTLKGEQQNDMNLLAWTELKQRSKSIDVNFNK